MPRPKANYPDKPEDAKLLKTYHLKSARRYQDNAYNAYIRGDHGVAILETLTAVGQLLRMYEDGVENA